MPGLLKWNLGHNLQSNNSEYDNAGILKSWKITILESLMSGAVGGRSKNRKEDYFVSQNTALLHVTRDMWILSKNMYYSFLFWDFRILWLVLCQLATKQNHLSREPHPKSCPSSLNWCGKSHLYPPTSCGWHFLMAIQIKKAWQKEEDSPIAPLLGFLLTTKLIYPVAAAAVTFFTDCRTSISKLNVV